MFVHVSIWGVILAALSAMIVGTIWYSPILFGKEWSKITGITEKRMKETRSTAMLLVTVVSLVTAYALSLLISYLHTSTGYSWFSAGTAGSLLAGIGFAATAVFAHGVFDTRSKNLMYINVGNRIVTLFIMGIIISAFLR